MTISYTAMLKQVSQFLLLTLPYCSPEISSPDKSDLALGTVERDIAREQMLCRRLSSSTRLKFVHRCQELVDKLVDLQPNLVREEKQLHDIWACIFPNYQHIHTDQRSWHWLPQKPGARSWKSVLHHVCIIRDTLSTLSWMHTCESWKRDIDTHRDTGLEHCCI